MARRLFVVQDQPAHAAGWTGSPACRSVMACAGSCSSSPASPRSRTRTYRQPQDQMGGPNGWFDMYGVMSVNKLRFFTGRGPRGNPVAVGARRPRTACRPQSLAPVQPADVFRCADHAAGAPAREQGRPHRDALVGRGALCLPRRGRDRVHGEAPPALEAPRRLQGQVRRAEGRRAVAAEGSRLAAQAHVPRPDGYAGREIGWRFVDRPGTSPESLQKAGYFDPAAVAAAREKLAKPGRGLARTSLEMGLTAVTATQLWHHLYIGGDLCDLSSRVESRNVVSSQNGAAGARTLRV